MKIEVYSPTIRRKEMDAVLTAMVEDKIGPGEQARLLIQIAKERLRFDYCLALRSPAIALYLALKAMNLEDGRGVLISALSPRYYHRVIEDLRLRPVYCDVTSGSPLMGRNTIEEALSRKDPETGVRCIVLHHTLGFVPDTASIAELGIPIIDDRSQSYGAGFLEEAGKSAGSAATEERPQGDARPPRETGSGGLSGVFTILGLEERDMLTSGGGALLYAVSRRDGSALRNYGDLSPEYSLPDMNAAMAVIQFRESARNLEKRLEIARIYTQSALRTRHRRFVQGDEGYNNYAFPLVLETGLKDVKTYARKKDILVESAFENTLIGFALTADGGAALFPAAVSPASGDGGAGEENSVSRFQDLCPEAYSLSLRTVLFPLYPRLSSSEVERISKLILTLP
ncbi:MAG: DegT/DnrJ/EryC1/StrS family aminotransferase [Treponema sp.]|jgi:dTDP-4-amino-4,6-dideoxygalactose transaminase|nr:DegT/DnrJ/EryC1/StrS family aminotransferase [Treponema sp.]